MTARGRDRVETDCGWVAGQRLGRTVVFKGVPYAEPPFGGGLWRPPSARRPWRGELKADRFGDVCPQVRTGGPLGELFDARHPTGPDCLNLNIWAPAEGERLPVYVWIHGGAFTLGSNTDPVYDGEAFAEAGVVFVSINYRLGLLGFLHLDDRFEGLEHTGNLGLLDQVAALQWVARNIAAFGGDPAQVTVGGESAGAMSVAALLTSPRARGLFKRAILQSPSFPLSIDRGSAGRVADFVLNSLDVAPGDTEALAARSVEDVFAAQQALRAAAAGPQAAELFGLAVARSGTPLLPVDGTEILPAPPLDVLARRAPPIDCIVGFNRDEFGLFLGGLDEAVAQAMLGLAPAVYGPAAAEVLAAIAEDPAVRTGRQTLVAFHSQMRVGMTALRLAEATSAAGARAWLYRFDWQASDVRGACHTLELPFVAHRLDNAQARALVGDSPPVGLAEVMHGAWTNFIARGDPNGMGLPAWRPSHASAQGFLAFDVESRERQGPISPAVLRSLERLAASDHA